VEAIIIIKIETVSSGEEAAGCCVFRSEFLANHQADRFVSFLFVVFPSLFAREPPLLWPNFFQPFNLFLWHSKSAFC